MKVKKMMHRNVEWASPKGVITPLGHLRRGGGGSLSPGSILPLRGTGDAASGLLAEKNGITAAAANPEILPLEFLLGDDPVHGSLSGWIAEW